MTRRLTRDTKNAILGGVAAGVANYFGVDPVLVRIVFIALVFLSGFGLVAYVVGWIIVPRDDKAADAPGSAGASPQPAGGAAVPVDHIVETVREAGERLADEFHRTPPGEGRGRMVAGTTLIVLGVLFLLDRLAWWHWPRWARLSNLWPVILIAVGVAVILEATRGRGGKTA